MTSETSRGWGVAIGWIVSTVIVAVLFWLVVQPWLVFAAVKGTFDFVVANIVAVSGLNGYLVRGVVLAALIPFGWALAEVVRIDLVGRMTGRSRSSRRGVQVVLVLYVCIYFLVMYAASRNSMFTVEDGSVRALKYCAQTPAGFRCYDTPGVDREFGIPLVPITSEEAVARGRESMGKLPRRLNVTNVSDVTFFDTLRPGVPLVWFYRNERNEIEFFDSSGAHPQTGAALAPVTPDVVSEYRKQLDRREEAVRANAARLEREREDEAKRRELEAQVADRLRAESLERSMDAQREARRRRLIVGSGDLNGKAAVHIVDERSNTASSLANQIATDTNGSAEIFTREFVESGGFERAYSGDPSFVSELKLLNVGPAIILGRVKTAVTPTRVAETDLVKVDTVLAARVYRAAGSQSAMLTVTGTAVSFSESDAARKAEAEVAKALLARLR